MSIGLPLIVITSTVMMPVGPKIMAKLDANPSRKPEPQTLDVDPQRDQLVKLEGENVSTTHRMTFFKNYRHRIPNLHGWITHGIYDSLR